MMSLLCWTVRWICRIECILHKSTLSSSWNHQPNGFYNKVNFKYSLLSNLTSLFLAFDLYLIALSICYRFFITLMNKAERTFHVTPYTASYISVKKMSEYSGLRRLIAWITFNKKISGYIARIDWIHTVFFFCTIFQFLKPIKRKQSIYLICFSALNPSNTPKLRNKKCIQISTHLYSIHNRRRSMCNDYRGCI